MSESVSDPRVVTIQEKDQTWIILDDPTSLNALDAPLVRALAKEIESVKTGTLVITGRNGAFSSGGSLKVLSELSELSKTDVLGVESIVREGGNVIEDLLFSSATTIALIDGACAGAGIAIALACDYQLATHRTRFSSAYASLNLPTDFGTYELLKERIGEEEATKFIKNTDLMGITRAQEIGLVDGLIERTDRKGVKKAIKDLKPRSRKALLKHISANLDSEAAVFARAMTNPRTQIKIEKAVRKLKK
ncbi:enoyl-CoA hydratase/isomerase family protein [Flaviflexus ciconiae]|uniref:enoyl-CoA hydratase/isomerase family protein n=1 Tax=Flaviflexus ciconiae TaxID=2496867 RepID=UPI0013DEB381|nr:enoyl-CoA hydratase-related protein [Flaviflexus ciconiae]